MRIVMLINGLGLGGGERHLAHLVSGLRRRHHRVSVFCLTRWGEVAEELRAAGVPVTRLSHVGVPRPLAWGHLLAELRRADVLHTHFYYSDLTARTVLWPCRPARLVATRHETGFWMTAAHRRLEPWLYRGFDRVVCVSGAVREGLVARGADADRVLHVRPGVAVPEEGAAAQREQDAPYLLFAGRLERVKGADVLVSALARAGAALSGWRLLICGDGAERGALTALIGRLGLQDRCTFLGGQSHRRTLELMQRAGVFVLPSRSEAVSLSLLEAMATGAAVVASDVDGVREVVGHMDSGLLVPAEDPAALAAALTQLTADRALRHRLGTAARELVTRQFGLSRFVDEMEAVYSGDGGPAAAGGSSKICVPPPR